MREERTTFNVQEEKEEDVYCDICGAKTDDPHTVYVKDESKSPVKGTINTIKSTKEGDFGPSEIELTDFISIYESSEHDVCEGCIETFDGGEDEYVHNITENDNTKTDGAFSGHSKRWSIIPQALGLSLAIYMQYRRGSYHLHLDLSCVL